jgi:hypothetical protein
MPLDTQPRRKNGQKWTLVVKNVVFTNLAAISNAAVTIGNADADDGFLERLVSSK